MRCQTRCSPLGRSAPDQGGHEGSDGDDGQDRLVHVRRRGYLRLPTASQASTSAASSPHGGRPQRGPVRDRGALAGPARHVHAELLHPEDHRLRVDGGRGPVVLPHALVAGGLHEHGGLLDGEPSAAPAGDPLEAIGVVGVEHEVHRVALVDDVVVVPVPRRGADVHERRVGRGDHALAGRQLDGRQAAGAVALEGEVLALERRHLGDGHRLERAPGVGVEGAVDPHLHLAREARERLELEQVARSPSPGRPRR